MFREIRFYDDYTAAVASPWWIFALLGVDFVLLGKLIVIFPQLLAWLVAGCLIFNGLLLLGVAWQLWRFKKNYRKWRDVHWLP
jgi:cytochrome c biogenesis protein CcdA